MMRRLASLQHRMPHAMTQADAERVAFAAGYAARNERRYSNKPFTLHSESLQELASIAQRAVDAFEPGRWVVTVKVSEESLLQVRRR
jgi:hypothetical protein